MSKLTKTLKRMYRKYLEPADKRLKRHEASVNKMFANWSQINEPKR